MSQSPPSPPADLLKGFFFWILWTLYIAIIVSLATEGHQTTQTTIKQTNKQNRCSTQINYDSIQTWSMFYQTYRYVILKHIHMWKIRIEFCKHKYIQIFWETFLRNICKTNLQRIQFGSRFAERDKGWGGILCLDRTGQRGDSALLLIIMIRMEED